MIKSRFLSLVLRHKPEQIGIQLDEQGWTDVETLLSKMDGTFEELEEVVETNNKKRFAFNEDKTKIRANQGHSVVKIDYEYKVPPVVLFHGTAQKNVESIFKHGIQKKGRHHVHLSKDRETALDVGQRHGKPIILEVMALYMSELDYEFYLSDNGVWLTDFVPPKYLLKE